MQVSITASFVSNMLTRLLHALIILNSVLVCHRATCKLIEAGILWWTRTCLVPSLVRAIEVRVSPSKL